LDDGAGLHRHHRDSRDDPGPIAVNAATFVGYKTAGILGGLFATTGVAAPSAMLILLVADFILKHKDHPLKVSVFSALRPVVAALVLSAAFFVAETSLLTLPPGGFSLSALLSAPLRFIDLKSVGILAFTLVSALILKLHPILTIILAGAAGILLYGFLLSEGKKCSAVAAPGIVWTRGYHEKTRPMRGGHLRSRRRARDNRRAPLPSLEAHGRRGRHPLRPGNERSPARREPHGEPRDHPGTCPPPYAEAERAAWRSGKTPTTAKLWPG
jgi:chromate transporter